MKKLLAIACVVTSCLAEAGTNDLVVNVSGIYNPIQLAPCCFAWAPLTVHLDAGTYTVTPVKEGYPGALYTAFSYGSPGWSAAYAIAFDQTHVTWYGDGTPVGDPLTAFSHAAGASFSIATARDVYFGIGDSMYNDNAGGVSLHLVNTTPVPEPQTYAMMLAGLGLLGFAAHRRKQEPAA
jgi:hypothetical protein